ncbi:hypothetical protein H0A61_00694 [Koleobacter methoxysyntrophicus]|uniref:Aspartate/glutamate racemase family protein n=1 Tax=Koleobacter methoxysyntrophicus TaxID=2751313 RepID=A0A8A0RKG7_9FIRM|nr:aspartate/glutamate racemase family protein [Koleobacter methoxysyntrophicus]QSQ08372.1 hypothetical protein H0A61_00694 [Koleobacter methoxysyntrophicus]
MKLKGGYTNYGEAIGILMLDTRFPRAVGDIGNALSFPFPVKYKKIKFALPERVVKEADITLLEPFIEGARELEREGVKAITTSCGFLAMFQNQLAASVNIPVFTSSLIQVPFIFKIMGSRGKVGIITASKASLTQKHFESVGIKKIPIVVTGMDDMEEFSRVFLGNEEDLDFEKCEKEMEIKSLQLIKENPDVKSIVLECTNMSPFRKRIQKVTQRPVFDIITLTKYIYMGIEFLALCN